MDFELIIMLLLAVIIVLLVWNQRRIKARLGDITFQKQSQSVKYGKMSEQFFPFLKDYPYDPQEFRFLGTPVDGVQFTDDKVIFVEFKANTSRLSEKQKRVKELIEKKKVTFEERRI
ncbi:MAG: endonuclease [Nanoarchaeota archaeon]|nr:endonuclease [Nanoarchaeota archaeon]